LKTGKEESRILGGLKAMRKRLQEKCEAAKESIPAHKLSHMSDEEIARAAKERAKVSDKDESRIRAGMKAMRAILHEETGVADRSAAPQNVSENQSLASNSGGAQSTTTSVSSGENQSTSTGTEKIDESKGNDQHTKERKRRIPPEDLEHMSDEEIEGQAHKRYLQTGKDESRVRGGFKAMRKQIQENKGIGAAVRQHHSGAETVKYDDAQHIASMSDEEIEIEAHERADMHGEKDEKRIRGGLKAMRTLLKKSQGNLEQKQGDENNAGKCAEKTGTDDKKSSLQGGNHAGEKRSLGNEEAENRASKKQNVEQKEQQTSLPAQETAPVV